MCQEGGGSRRGGLGGHWGFLTGDLEDRVILDIMDDLGGPKGIRSYPEGFVSLSLFLAEIYKFVVLAKKRYIHTADNIHCRNLIDEYGPIIIHVNPF